ncbi:DNA-binding protein [Lactococcus formosensis]|uniref:DNA-binding protein n=1 Tax=Lactococcus formosensis TaxID=1281486 RepID=UPI0024353AF7|nr:DNA-binding protein [Lactococcus formosensis]MDG6159652.1 DNA-binding protein [Lactococcus formosensis]MDG6165886.1 DNA-binding protein [Lactococcus formosensis]MDG6172344.1 DNA-binding protein [Lactococcus formosensis]
MAQVFGVNANTLGNDLTAMRRLPDFADAILRVSHKRVYISYDGYEAYLKYKAEKWAQ